MIRHPAPITSDRGVSISGRRWLSLTSLVVVLGCSAHGADTASGDAMGWEGLTPASSESGESEAVPLLGGGQYGVDSAREADADPAEDTPMAMMARVATTNHRGGSRLEARFLTTDEGFKAWVGWHDTTLNEDCTFQADEQGTQRCFPLNATQEIYFSNESCTRGFVPTSDDAEGGYYYRGKPNECGTGIRAFALGEPIEAPANAFALDEAGRCAPVTLGGDAFRALGAPVDPTTFVAAEYGVIDTQDRVASYGLIAEDGAYGMAGFYDEELQTPCSWVGDGDGAAACVPHAKPVERFADPSLSQPLLRDETDDCASFAPSVGVRFDEEGRAHYYDRGAIFEGDTVYGNLPQLQAGSTAMTPNARYYVGEEIAMDRLAKAVMTQVENSPTRLVPLFWQTRVGESWFNRWYDASLGTTCAFTADTDGLCLPSGEGVKVVYTDDGCSQPIAELPRHDACEEGRAEPPLFARERSVQPNGEPRVQMRRLTKSIDVGSTYVMSNGVCELRGADGDRDYFALSAPMPRAAFISGHLPEATRAVEVHEGQTQPSVLR